MIQRIKNKLIYQGLIKPTPAIGKKAIIMYHGIDRTENMLYNTRFFSVSNFEKQVAYFKKNYHIVSLADYYEDRNMAADKLNVAITFDDGYQNNLLYAQPVLERYEAPATFFITGLNTINEPILWADLVDICTPSIREPSIPFDGQVFDRDERGRFGTLKAYIKKSNIAETPLFTTLKETLLSMSQVNLEDPALYDYWKLLTDDEIRAVGRSKYVRVGSHGMYHNNLGNMPVDRAVSEIVASKKYLEGLVQYEIDSIGYPDGSYTPRLSERGYGLGYKYQCAVYYNHGETPSTAPAYLQHRIGLYPVSSLSFLNYEINNFCA